SRHIAPDDVAHSGLPLAALLYHSLRLGLDEIEQGIAAHLDEAMRPEQRLDPFARPAAEERQAVADPSILRAPAGILRRLNQETRVELAVDDDQASAWTQHANPLVDCRLRMRQRPQNMAADRQIKTVGRER